MARVIRADYPPLQFTVEKAFSIPGYYRTCCAKPQLAAAIPVEGMLLKSHHWAVRGFWQVGHAVAKACGERGMVVAMLSAFTMDGAEVVHLAQRG